MRCVIQRVMESHVTIEDRVAGKIGPGLLVLLGIGKTDNETDADYLVDKVIGLRIFEDENDKMNRSLIDTGGEMLVVSQFTLFGDCRKGRRPSFTEAAASEKAEHLYEYFVDRVKGRGIHVGTGEFGAMMAVSLINDGPVTLIVESK